MAFFDPSNDSASRPSIHTALGDVVTHGHQLLINRLDLMQVELRDIGHRAVVRSMAIAVGGLLAFTGFVLLTVAAVLFSSLSIGLPWACLAGGGLYMALGALFVVRAKNADNVEVSTELVPEAPAKSHGGTYAD
jgi:hypothetical protein